GPAARARGGSGWRWPRWRPSNTPMTAKIGPSPARSPSTPAIVDGSRSGTRNRRGPGVDQHLVRRETPVAVLCDRDERAVRVADANRAVAGRDLPADELAARDRGDVRRGDG